VRQPRGRIADRIAEVGEQHLCTGTIVAAELRCGAVRKASLRLAGAFFVGGDTRPTPNPILGP
jgi:tRNA(fMet)-specific endonuclease VapC